MYSRNAYQFRKTSNPTKKYRVSPNPLTELHESTGPPLHETAAVEGFACVVIVVVVINVLVAENNCVEAANAVTAAVADRFYFKTLNDLPISHIYFNLRSLLLKINYSFYFSLGCLFP